MGKNKLKVSTLFQGVLDINTKKKKSQQLRFVNREAFGSIQTIPAVALLQEEKQTLFKHEQVTSISLVTLRRLPVSPFFRLRMISVNFVSSFPWLLVSHR